MGYLFDNCTISVFTEELLSECEPDVLSFYRKNGFETLFTTEQQEDFYVNPPKDEEQRLMRLANPAKLETRLMFTDLLKE